MEADFVEVVASVLFPFCRHSNEKCLIRHIKTVYIVPPYKMTSFVCFFVEDCHSVERKEKSISVNDKGFMKLYKASEGDAGKYTCLVDITLDGREYTAARSIQLKIKNGVYCESLSPEASSDTTS